MPKQTETGKITEPFGGGSADLNDIGTWRKIYATHYSPLCRLANLFLRDPDSAEDVVSDVIFNLWTRRNDTLIAGSLQSYLARAVRNKCLNELRKPAARQEYCFSSLSQSENIDFLGKVFSADEYPLGHLLQRELECEIRQAVETLPDDCRTVFSKSRYENKTYKQIAQDLGISVNTVKYHIKNALSLLHKRLSVYMKLLFL